MVADSDGDGIKDNDADLVGLLLNMNSPSWKV